MSFAKLQLDQRIIKALNHRGYKEPTPIQNAAIPHILEGKDIIATAQTGTGKTAAFVLPALQKLTQEKKTFPSILILTPTRELSRQVNEAVHQYGKFLKLGLANLVGGMPYHEQIRQLKKPTDIIVATPGRLIDHLENHRVNLSKIETLILDEADRMLDMGFIDDIKLIVKKTAKERQTLLFSATFDLRLDEITKSILKNPVRVDISPKVIAPQKIEQTIHFVDNYQHKIKLLEHYFSKENIYKAIIFSSTKINADRLSNALIEKGFLVSALHGDLRQNKRNRVIDSLKRGKIQYLVATNIAARGIDISDLTHVFNFDLPSSHEDYVHRIGRTGRAGSSGKAISFVLPNERIFIKRIQKFTNQSLSPTSITGLEPKQSAKPNNANKKKPRKKSFSRHHQTKPKKAQKKS